MSFEVTTHNSSQVFRQMIREAGGSVSEPTKEFSQTMQEVSANFTYSGTMRIFAPYSAGLSFVRQVIAYRCDEALENSNLSAFAVMPVYDPDLEEYTYALMLNESQLWRILDPNPEKSKKAAERVNKIIEKRGKPFESRDELLATISPEDAKLLKLRHEDQKIITFNQVLEAFCEEHGPEEGYLKVIASLRFAMMHEVLHITLAHHAREEKQLRDFGLSSLIDDQKLSQADMKYRRYLHEIANKFQDTFINEGLMKLQKDTTPILENDIRATETIPGQYAPKIEDIRRDLGHLYQFSMDNIPGQTAETLVKELESLLKDYPDLQEAAKPLLTAARDGKLLGEFLEEDAYAFAIAALLRRKEDDLCPCCGKPNAPEEHQQQKSEDGKSQEQQENSGSGESSEAGESEESSGSKEEDTENEGKDGESQGNGQPSENQETQDGNSQSPGQDGQDGKGQDGKGEGAGQGKENGQSQSGGQGSSSQGSSGGYCDCHLSQKTRTVIVDVQTSSGTAQVAVTLDENGNIVSMTPTKGSGNSTEKLDELETDVGRQILEIEKSCREELSDEERAKIAGIGSVYGRSLSKVVEKSFPWDIILRDMVGRFPVDSVKQSWAKPVRALDRLGFKYPDEDTSSNPNGHSLVMYLDSSGSVNDMQVSKALGSVLSAASANVKSIYLILHDYDVANYANVPKLSRMAANCGADKKVLQKYGVLKFSLNDAKASKRKVLQLLKELAKMLPEGGTSHVRPTQTLIDNGFFKKELSRSKLSGFVFYTDCCSDLETLPPLLLPQVKKLGVKSSCPAVIVDCEKSSTYSHAQWPVVNTAGKFTPATTKKVAAR